MNFFLYTSKNRFSRFVCMCGSVDYSVYSKSSVVVLLLLLMFYGGNDNLQNSFCVIIASIHFHVVCNGDMLIACVACDVSCVCL